MDAVCCRRSDDDGAVLQKTDRAPSGAARRRHRERRIKEEVPRSHVELCAGEEEAEEDFQTVRSQAALPNDPFYLVFNQHYFINHTH